MKILREKRRGELGNREKAMECKTARTESSPGNGFHLLKGRRRLKCQRTGLKASCRKNAKLDTMVQGRLCCLDLGLAGEEAVGTQESCWPAAWHCRKGKDARARGSGDSPCK